MRLKVRVSNLAVLCCVVFFFFNQFDCGKSLACVSYICRTRRESKSDESALQKFDDEPTSDDIASAMYQVSKRHVLVPYYY